MIVDAHAHAFPDAIAAKAIARLEEGNCKANHDGTVAGLLGSMDRAGIDKAVVCSIATKPAQFEPILRWSLEIASDRILPLASIHPADPMAREHVGVVAAAGMKGLKLHPYYQDFDLAGEAVLPILEAAEEAGLVVVSHTGFDMAFPRERKADPDRVRRVVERFPGLRFVATHFGGWQDWEEVRAKLLGRRQAMELSLSLDVLAPEQAGEMILGHPEDCVMFGTDSPWSDAADALRRLRSLGLPPERLRKIEGGNAARWFGL